MADSISRREYELRKAQKKRAKAEKKARRAEARSDRDAAMARKLRDKNSTGGREKMVSMRFMFLSSLILLGIFFLFEILLLISSGNLGDLDTHLANMADNTLAFVVGLGALDAVTYLNTVGRRRRDENRAIIRHNRLLEPLIDTFIARKNALTTFSDEPFDQYAVVKNIELAPFQDMFKPSVIASDAGISKISMYSFHQKQLFKSFQKMVEDVDFSYHPEACDAAMSFINATTKGFSALSSLLALEEDDNKKQREAFLKILAEQCKDTESDQTRPEIMSLYILIQSIRDQQEALELYLESVSDVVDPDH